MSEWEFLYEMQEKGYSADEIAEAAANGYAPWEYFDEDVLNDAAIPLGDTNPHPNFGSILPKREILADLLQSAEAYFELTGRYLQIWGELGELYAETEFGLIRPQTPHQAGSEGFIGNKLTEVNTISPENDSKQVKVKMQGNFQQLLIIKIDGDFNFSGKLIDRDKLQKLSGAYLGGKI